MNTTMRRVATLLVAVLILPVLALVAMPGSANATGDDCLGECTDKWTRTVPQEHTEYKYAKYVRTKTRTWVEGTDAEPDQWWNWSPNHTEGPQDYEPAFPTDPRGTWQGPHNNGGPQQDTYGTFQTSSGGNSNWFHREQGSPGTEGHWSDWSAYGPWELWTPMSHVTWEDFNVESIGGVMFHGSGTYQDGTQWYREWQVRNTGETRTVQDEPIVQTTRSAETPPLDFEGVNSDVPWVKVEGTRECPPVDCPPVTPAVATPPPGVDKCEPQRGSTLDRLRIPYDREFYYKVNGVRKPAGAIVASGTRYVVRAFARSGFVNKPGSPVVWRFTFTKKHCYTPPAPTVVRGDVVSVDKCGTRGDWFAVKPHRGIVYRADGRVVRENVRIPTRGDRRIVIQASALKGYVLDGQRVWTKRFTNKPCGSPHVPPPTGAKAQV